MDIGDSTREQGEYHYNSKGVALRFHALTEVTHNEHKQDPKIEILKPRASSVQVEMYLTRDK